MIVWLQLSARLALALRWRRLINACSWCLSICSHGKIRRDTKIKVDVFSLLSLYILSHPLRTFEQILNQCFLSLKMMWMLLEAANSSRFRMKFASKIVMKSSEYLSDLSAPQLSYYRWIIEFVFISNTHPNPLELHTRNDLWDLRFEHSAIPSNQHKRL